MILVEKIQIYFNVHTTYVKSPKTFSWRSRPHVNALCKFNLGFLSTGISFLTLGNLLFLEINFCEINFCLYEFSEILRFVGKPVKICPYLASIKIKFKPNCYKFTICENVTTRVCTKICFHQNEST